MGHEFSGDVIAVGTNVVGIKKWDRVAPASYKPCGECYWCQRREPNRCSQMKVLGYDFPGAFAERVSIPLALLNKTVFLIPEEMSYEVGATVEPLSVGVHVARRAEPTTEQTVVVLGAGTIGLCAMQVFKVMGVSKIIVIDVSRKRLEIARTMGADEVINAAREEPLRRILESTAETGADIVAECAGSPATFQLAIEMVRGGGKIMLVGSYEEPILWEPVRLMRKNARMIGCFAGSFPRALDFLKTGKVNSKPLITHEFSLARAREAFETQSRVDEAVKVLIKP